MLRESSPILIAAIEPGLSHRVEGYALSLYAGITIFLPLPSFCPLLIRISKSLQLSRWRTGSLSKCLSLSVCVCAHTRITFQKSLLPLIPAPISSHYQKAMKSFHLKVTTGNEEEIKSLKEKAEN